MAVADPDPLSLPCYQDSSANSLMHAGESELPCNSSYLSPAVDFLQPVCEQGFQSRCWAQEVEGQPGPLQPGSQLAAVWQRGTDHL